MRTDSSRHSRAFSIVIILTVFLLVIDWSLVGAKSPQPSRKNEANSTIHLRLSDQIGADTPGQDRWYALVYHNGDFTGVHGNISVADPVLRHEGAGNSGAKIAIIFPGGGWIETGWTKQSHAPTGNQCNPVHYWAVDPGWPVFVTAAGVGANYRYTIAMSDATRGFWLVRIIDNYTNHVVFEKTDIVTNNGSLPGRQIQALGEVGPAPVQDMGISGLLDLRFRKQLGSGWPLWNPPGRRQDPPYAISGLWGTWSAFFQVAGQQGTPGYYCQ